MAFLISFSFLFLRYLRVFFIAFSENFCTTIFLLLLVFFSSVKRLSNIYCHIGVSSLFVLSNESSVSHNHLYSSYNTSLVLKGAFPFLRCILRLMLSVLPRYWNYIIFLWWPHQFAVQILGTFSYCQRYICCLLEGDDYSFILASFSTVFEDPAFSFRVCYQYNILTKQS